MLVHASRSACGKPDHFQFEAALHELEMGAELAAIEETDNVCLELVGLDEVQVSRQIRHPRERSDFLADELKELCVKHTPPVSNGTVMSPSACR